MNGTTHPAEEDKRCGNVTREAGGWIKMEAMERNGTV